MDRFCRIPFDTVFDACATVRTKGARAVAARPVGGNMLYPDVSFLAYGFALAVLRVREERYPDTVTMAGRMLADSLCIESRHDVEDLARGAPL